MRKALYLLGILEDSDLEWLMRYGTKLALEPGAILIEEGKPCDSLYFVLDGTFVVFTRKSPRLAVLRAGEVVGEVSFVDARPPTASVRAEVPATVGAVPRTALAQKLRDDIAFASRFYRSIATFLADRLRRTTGSLGVQNVLDEGLEDEGDNLPPHLLRNVSIAGTRFVEMQRRDWGGVGAV